MAESTNEIRFDGRTAIVTGAGGGLGRTYAIEMARRGANVVVTDLATPSGESKAAVTVAEIRDGGGSAASFDGSVSTPGIGSEVLALALDQFGSADVFIHNAGIVRDAPFEEMELDAWRAVHEVHLEAVIHMFQPVYRHMLEAEYGRIVFTASSSGVFGSPWQSNYAAAKAGLVGLNNALALEATGRGVQSNVVLPMAFTTIEGLRLEPSHGARVGAASIPLIDRLTPEHVAALVVYLCSEECSETRSVFAAEAGRFARVFTALGEGWMTPETVPASVEDIAAHWSQIAAIEPFTVPLSLADVVEGLANRV